MEPKSGFDWSRVRWTGPLAPVDDTCSYCGAAIPDDEIPLRLWTPDSSAAAFCRACQSAWWGIVTFDDEDL